MNQAYDKLDKGNRLFVAGLREMQPDKKFYPDANFTMRVSYGSVGGYQPYDAAWYTYYTTTKGVFEKEDPKKLASILSKGTYHLMHRLLDKEIDNYFPVKLVIAE